MRSWQWCGAFELLETRIPLDKTPALQRNADRFRPERRARAGFDIREEGDISISAPPRLVRGAQR